MEGEVRRGHLPPAAALRLLRGLGPRRVHDGPQDVRRRHRGLRPHARPGRHIQVSTSDSPRVVLGKAFSSLIHIMRPFLQFWQLLLSASISSIMFQSAGSLKHHELHSGCFLSKGQPFGELELHAEKRHLRHRGGQGRAARQDDALRARVQRQGNQILAWRLANSCIFVLTTFELICF